MAKIGINNAFMFTKRLSKRANKFSNTKLNEVLNDTNKNYAQYLFLNAYITNSSKI